MNAVARHVTAAREVSVQDVAARMLQESGGDMVAAATKMINYISSFPRMQNEIIRLGVSTLMSRVAPIERAVFDRELGRQSETAAPFVSAPYKMSEAVKAAQARVRHIGKTAGDALLNYPYTINGMKKPLRDFTGDEVRQHGETMLLTAGTAMRNANYLVWVGQAAGAKKVGTLDVATIETFRKRADEMPV